MKIKIVSPSDTDSERMKIRLGDYWVQHDLNEEFKSRGYEIVEGKADVDIYLFGTMNYLNKSTAPRKILWIYSHPAIIQSRSAQFKQFATKFEHIFVLSNSFIKNVQNRGVNCSVLLGGTSKQFVPRKKDPEFDLIFVGNSSKPARVQAMRHLIATNKYKICVVGGRWDTVLGDSLKKVDYRGPYVDNQNLGELFNEAKLSFYSSHEDMRLEGFVAVRIMDIFASSENLCISDSNKGLKDIYSNIPTFSSPKELEKKVDWFLAHPNEIKEAADRCRKETKQFSFKKIVTEMEKWITRK